MKSPRYLHFLILVLLALTWGSSFILMKRGLKDELNQPVLSSAQVAALRLGLAGLILLPISARAIFKIKLSDWKWLAVVGLIGSGLPAILFTVSQQYIASSVAGILNALTPVFTLIIGILFFRKTVLTRQVIGVLIGLIGAAGLVSLGGFTDSQNLNYSLLIVLATLFYGISVNTISTKLTHLLPLHITAISLLLAGIPWTIYLSTTDVITIIQTHPHGMQSFGYVFLLALFGTCMANMLYFWLTLQTSPLFASSVTYLMPLVAVGWGLMDNEKLNMLHLVFTIIIIGGIWLVNKRK